MKKLLFTLIVLLIAVPAMAGQAVFTWDYDSESLLSLSHWSLKIRSTATGAIDQSIDIPYSGEVDLTFTSTQNIAVTGDPGATVSKYFTLTAVSKNGNESGESNQVSAEFILPWADVKTPVSLTVTISVQGP